MLRACSVRRSVACCADAPCMLRAMLRGCSLGASPCHVSKTTTLLAIMLLCKSCAGLHRLLHTGESNSRGNNRLLHTGESTCVSKPRGVCHRLLHTGESTCVPKPLGGCHRLLHTAKVIHRGRCKTIKNNQFLETVDKSTVQIHVTVSII